MEEQAFFAMIGANLTPTQIVALKKIIEYAVATSAENFVIAYADTAKEAYSEVKKELDRFNYEVSDCWN